MDSVSNKEVKLSLYLTVKSFLFCAEAALGVLKASSLWEALTDKMPAGGELSSKFSRHHACDMCYSVLWSTEKREQHRVQPIDLTANSELWLAKLGSWTEALAVYKNTLKRNPNDFEAMLGCMQCLESRGEWRKVLKLASDKWDAMTGSSASEYASTHDIANPRSRRRAVRICAQAAWRLGQWDELDKFAGQLVGVADSLQTRKTEAASLGGKPAAKLDFDGSFFQAVLRVHKKDWITAANAIDDARKAMDSRLTALMAESYSRAYPSMVTAQTLAEMEEIVEFRKLEERSLSGASQHPTNRPNSDEARSRLLSVWRDRLAGCRADADVHSSILAVRSLILGPDDEVEATLMLSELSRQAQRHKYAERVLLDPLEALKADLNGPPLRNLSTEGSQNAIPRKHQWLTHRRG